jgi:dihydrofolate reductase
MIKIIVATSKNGVIGKDNKLLWRQSDDLKRFKSLTLDKKVVMGRKTFESIGKPLPKRENYVITRQNVEIPGCKILNNINDVSNLDGDVFIIGGGEIYDKFIEISDEIYLTIIDCELEGDTFFPGIDGNLFNKVFEESNKKDSNNEYDYVYQNWIRKWK